MAKRSGRDRQLSVHTCIAQQRGLLHTPGLLVERFAAMSLQKEPLRQALLRSHSCSFPLSSGILDMAFFKNTWAESVEFVHSHSGGYLSFGTTPPALRVSATSTDELHIAVALVEDYISDIKEEYVLWVEPFASVLWVEPEHGEHGEQPACKKSRVQQRLFRPASS